MLVKEFVEQEYKGLITEADYFRLLGKYSPPIAGQVNYYFDTPDFDLHKKGFTLRLREKSGEWELTLKTGDGIVDESIKNNNTAVKNEYTQKLTQKPNLHRVIFLTNILHNCGAEEFFKTVLKGVRVEMLRSIGCLVTNRSKIEVGKKFVELDKNYYLNFTDYEIEFEYNDGRELSVLRTFLEENQITVLQSGGKYTRFMERYRDYYKLS